LKPLKQQWHLYHSCLSSPCVLHYCQGGGSGIRCAYSGFWGINSSGLIFGGYSVINQFEPILTCPLHHALDHWDHHTTVPQSLSHVLRHRLLNEEIWLLFLTQKHNVNTITIMPRLCP
jgi:hypothetical protein